MSKAHRSLDRRRWAYLRRLVLQRDGYRCQQCGKAGRLEVDHVVPLDRGGDPYDPANLQALCRGCHVGKTARENRTRRPVRPEEAAWLQLVDELLR